MLACKALGAEQLQLVSILNLIRKFGSKGNSLCPTQLADLFSYFGDINQITANKALNQWRMDYIEVYGEQS